MLATVTVVEDALVLLMEVAVTLGFQVNVPLVFTVSPPGPLELVRTPLKEVFPVPAKVRFRAVLVSGKFQLPLMVKVPPAMVLVIW